MYQYNLDCKATEVKTSQEIYNNFELLQGQCHASPPEYGLIRSETPSFRKVKELLLEREFNAIDFQIKENLDVLQI